MSAGRTWYTTAMGEIRPGNVEAVEAWNTVLFEKFSRYRELWIPGIAQHGTAAIERYVPREPARIVDIGCGWGDSTIELARRVGPNGRAVGIDAAANFLEVARADAAAAGVGNASFEVADVEAGIPGGPYDLAFSRTGTMFFASPVIAMRRVRESLRPGGRLCIVVWRKREANPCFHEAEQVAVELFGHPPKEDNLTCGPGPFSMASADLVSDQLIAAGYKDIAFERHDAPIRIGRDVDEAIGFALTLGPAGEVVRLAGKAAVERKAELDAALRKAFASHTHASGVVLPSSTWIITART